MINKSFKKLVILSLVFLCGFAYSQEVSMYEAEKIGKSFMEIYQETFQDKQRNFVVGDYQSLSSDEKQSPYVHVFNFKDGGFILVSGDNRSTPVLGYSYDSFFDAENLAPGTKMWIEGYKMQIQDIRENNIEATPEIKKMWNDLIIKNSDFVANKQGVSRLVETRWNQNYPYNYYCPPHPMGSGGRTYAGCVATAMAQIMKYHDFPESGRFSNTYFWGDTYEVNFEEAIYDWDAMGIRIFSHDTVGKHAIAKLMFHCGVAVNMNYGHDGSGASIFTSLHAMRHYFKYKSGMQHVDMFDYDNAEWKFLLKQDIDKGLPILYRGMNDAQYGHAYVVDGYQDTSFFHFNWGWGGASDGYFHLDNIHPQTLFPWNQGAVINIMSYDHEYCDELVYVQPHWTFDDGSGPNLYYPNTHCNWLISVDTDTCDFVKLSFTRFDVLQGDYVRVYDGNNTDAELLGEFTGQNIPAPVTSTGNELLIVFETTEEGQALGWEASYESIILDVDEHFTKNISVFPNPANDFVNINTNSDSPSNISVYDIYGKKHLEIIKTGNTSIDLSELSAGIYFVNIANENHNKTERLIIQ